MAVHYRQNRCGMSRELAHPVVRSVICTCVIADEVLLWDWLVDELRAGSFKVEWTQMVRDGHARRTCLQFTNELDGHRFLRWATSRGFEIEDRA